MAFIVKSVAFQGNKESNEKKQAIFQTYFEFLSDVKEIQLPSHRSYVESNWHLFPIRVNESRRTEVYDGLRKAGIGVQVNYIPAHWHPVFQKYGFSRGLFPISELFYSQEISLPMFTNLTKEQLRFISKTLLDLI